MGLCCYLLSTTLLTVVILVLKLWNRYRASKMTLINKHFLITGGSSGIGRSLCSEVVRRGGSVTIFARDFSRLEETKKELVQLITIPPQRVHTVSVNLSGDFEDVAQAVKDVQQEIGPIDYLVNCAGSAVSYRFDETPILDFQKMMSVNYLSAVFATRSVLPAMKQRKQGSITFVSSIAGLFGVYGYTAYAPSKYALVALAESLRMEVHHYNINVTVAFPPDTDTPGFSVEQRTKPEETKKISESGGLIAPTVVARTMLVDILEKNFMSYVGFDGWFVTTLCCGMKPFSSGIQALIEFVALGLMRVIGVVLLAKFYRIIKQSAITREKSKKKS